MNPAVAALILGATCIALSPIFVRVSEAGPTATAFWRVALAVPVLWILYWAKPKTAAGRYSGQWPLLLAAVLGGGIWALIYTSRAFWPTLGLAGVVMVAWYYHNVHSTHKKEGGF